MTEYGIAATRPLWNKPTTHALKTGRVAGMYAYKPEDYTLKEITQL